MTTTTALDAFVIDGATLRQAREARNLSVAEVAALCTLSREQVQHIEDGGQRPFYTPAHKLLAVRKYAGAMNIPFDDIVTGQGASETMPVPDGAPASLMVHGEREEATDLRLAAVERNAETRRMILIGVVTATILLAVYAKMRSAPDNPPTAGQPVLSNVATETRSNADDALREQASKAPAAAPATVASANLPAATSSAPAATKPTATAAAADKVAAPVASGPAEATAKPATASVAPAAPATPATPIPAPAALADAKASAKAGAAEPCASASAVGTDMKTWTPTYQRKADTRLFFVSTKETTVCVRDATGKAALLTLKARTGQAYSGKPPYVVQSPQLSEIDIYLQGMRARVPPQTPALRLHVTPVSAPDAG